jgi:hypothetical protein
VRLQLNGKFIDALLFLEITSVEAALSGVSIKKERRAYDNFLSIPRAARKKKCSSRPLLFTPIDAAAANVTSLSVSLSRSHIVVNPIVRATPCCSKTEQRANPLSIYIQCSLAICL